MAIPTYVYVDGFNLYYGALKNTNYKWLDLVELFKRILNTENDILKVKYFTARVEPRHRRDQTHNRQDVYLRALGTLQIVEIIEGHFLSHKRKLPLANSQSSKPKMVKVIKTEEKGSDVNLASHLLLDGFQNKYEIAVVVSNDSDLATPVRMVKQKLRKKVGIINPHGTNRSVQLSKFSTFYRTIKTTELEQAQFPLEIEDSAGRIIKKPDAW